MLVYLAYSRNQESTDGWYLLRIIDFQRSLFTRMLYTNSF